MPPSLPRLLIDARYQHAPTDLVRALIAVAEDLEIHVWLPLLDSEALQRARRAWEALLHHSRLHVAPGPRLDVTTPPGWARTAAEWIETAAILGLAPDVVWTPADPARVDSCNPPPCTDLNWVLTQPRLPVPEDDLHAQTAGRPGLARHWQWLKQASAVWTEDAAAAAILIERLLLASEAVHHFAAATPDERARELLRFLRARLSGGAARPARGDTRPTLAFVSPLPPERSGIADYSAELLPELARHYRLTLISAGEPTQDPWLRANFDVMDLAGFRASADRFDRRLYHLGNSHFHAHMPDLIAEHPGVVVLHDFYLGHLHAWRQLSGGEPDALIRALFESHGWPALRHLAVEGGESAIWRFPANGAQIADSAGVIVHSEHAIRLAHDWLPAAQAARLRRVAQLRRPPPALDRARARAELGLEAEAFVVCSFGFLGPSKRNADLLAAWLDSPLSRRPECRLVFVGQNAGGDPGEAMQRRLRALPPGVQVRITGFVTPDDYARWLAAADLAVQLRTLDRGETSRGVLDCLAHGIPLIVNAHGGLADLASDLVVRLPDDCTVGQLRAAIEALHADPDRRAGLSRRAREHIARHHHPVIVAAAFHECIEHLSRHDPIARRRRLIARLGCCSPPGASELESMLEPLARLDPADSAPGRWFIDISALRRAGRVTGIERVTHALLLALLDDPRLAGRVVPVQSCAEGYRQAWDYPLRHIGLDPGGLSAEPVQPRAGDLFLGLDWMPHDIPLHQARLAGWRARGVRLWFLVHDILPVTHPQWFPAPLPPLMRRWLAALTSLADGLLCVSAATADEVDAWCRAQGIEPPPLRVSHNGADFLPSDSAPPVLAPALESALAARPSLLMVGTLEPRKGHAQAFAALERLWSDGVDINLIVVGASGWPNDTAADRRPILECERWLLASPERERRLFWVRAADDATLAVLYQRASALLAAAEGEGFGLPLIEAAHYGLALIARDIPVFREIAGAHAWYFEAAPDPEGVRLAAALRDWLAARDQGRIPTSRGLTALTWSQSAACLREHLLADLESRR